MRISRGLRFNVTKENTCVYVYGLCARARVCDNGKLNNLAAGISQIELLKMFFLSPSAGHLGREGQR